MKKVCIVGISLAGGGAERSMAMLSQMLTTKGHEVHIAVLNDNIDYPYSGTLFNLGKFKKGKDNLLKRLLRLRKLRKYLLKNNFDFVVDHRPKNDLKREQFYQKYIYKGIKKIFVVHSSRQEEKVILDVDNFSSIYSNNFATVAVSKQIEKEVLQKNGITNTTTIYNAFDPAWENLAIEKPDELKGKTYILSYGRIDDDIKDISFLINSFFTSEIWKKGIHLVILGDGKDKEKLMQMAAGLKCSEYIVFIPFTNSPFSYIAHSKFVTLTSRYEGFPMVLVESLSLGTPVVSLDIHSGPSEIIIHGENGLLIQDRSIPLFAEALKSMVENETLYNRIKENTRSSVKKFSKDAIAEDWNKLINT